MAEYKDLVKKQARKLSQRAISFHGTRGAFVDSTQHLPLDQTLLIDPRDHQLNKALNGFQVSVYGDRQMSMSEFYKQLKKEEKHVTASNSELFQMKQEMQVNCLHRGDYDNPEISRKWLLCVDGSESSVRAFNFVLEELQPKDHLIIVTSYRTSEPKETESWEDEDPLDRRTLMAFRLWRFAGSILRRFEERLKAEKPGLDYTLLAPGHHDERKIIVTISQKYQVDWIVLGKHTKNEKFRPSLHRSRSFNSYLKHHLPKEVLPFLQAV